MSKDNLSNLFKEMRIKENKDDLLNARTGNEFENQIKTSLLFNGFHDQPINRKDDATKKIKKYLKEIKPHIKDPWATELMDNGLFEDFPYEFLVYQPYGTQSYPDFLLFTEKKIFELEIKYSAKKGNKIVWNGSFPKKKGIYLFASFGLKELTFFTGDDLLDDSTRMELIRFFKEDIKILEAEFDKRMKERVLDSIYHNKGFSISIRKAFKQNVELSKEKSLSLFIQPDKDIQEENVIKMIQDIEKPTP